MSPQVVVTMGWGQKGKRMAEVMISPADLDRLAMGAAEPEASIRCKDGRMIACSLPDSVRRQLAELALEDDTVDDIPEIAVGRDGILVMPKQTAWWTENVDGVVMTILLGKSKHNSGRIDDRYRIRFGGETLQTIFNDPERAKKRMRELGAIKAKEFLVKRSDEGKTLFELFESSLRDAGAVGITDFRAFLADSLTATDLLMKHAQHHPSSHTESGNGPTLVGMVNGIIERDERRKCKNPGLISHYGRLFIEHHRKLLNAGGAVAVFKRHSAHIGQFMKDYGTNEAHTIEHDVLDIWLDDRGKCQQQARASLKAFFTWMRDVPRALPRGATEADALVTRLAATTKKKGKITVGFYTDDQVQEILAAALQSKEAQPWIPVLIFRFFGGVHLTELMATPWSKVSDDGVITIVEDAAGRNHFARHIPLAPGPQTFLQTYLRAVKLDGLEDTSVVPGMIPGKEVQLQVDSRTDAFNAMFDTLLVATGISKVRNGLRHTFATYYYHLTFSIKHTREQMGSHDVNLFLIYIDIEVDRKNAVAFFCISHPDFPRPAKNDDWLPSDVTRKTKKEALHELNEALVADRMAKRMRGI